MPQEESCSTCKFFVPDSSPATTGKCHRNPPRVIERARSFSIERLDRRPEVDPSVDWCGEYKKK